MATRREKVILELEDNFSREMMQAATATALVKRELNSLSGTSVQTSRDSDRLSRSVAKVGDEAEKTGSKLRDGSRDIDRYSGRLRLLTEAAVVLGPALIPLGAAAIPAVAGLAAGFGVAAGAAGVALLAFQGVGDALKAIDAYQLEPTQANLEKMRQSLDALGPAGAEFAKYLDNLEPVLHDLQNTAREGLFPGVEEGINNLLQLLPQVRTIVGNVANAMGDLSAEAGSALAGDGFSAFFDYLEGNAAPLLTEFGHTLGNVAEGLASLTVAFGPLTNDFAGGMERASRAFADWAAGVSETQGFRDFVSYIRESGPQAVALLGALGNAFVGIIRAAAPFGSAVLPALTAFANVVAAIANSPLGQPLFTTAAAMLAMSRAATMLSTSLKSVRSSALVANGSLTPLGRFGAKAGGILLAAQAIGALANATTDLGNAVNSADISRDLEAIGSGATTDSLGKLTSALEGVNEAGGGTVNALFAIPSALTGIKTSFETNKDTVEQFDQALASLVESGHAKEAAAAFQQIRDAAAAHGGVSDSDVVKSFDAYRTALDNAANSGDNAAASTRRLGSSAGRSASEVQALTDAMEQQRQAALDAFGAVTRYAEALDEARKRAKQTNAGLSATTAEGRKNRDTLQTLAEAWNNQGAAVRNNLGKYAAARASLIQVATQMGATRAKAEQYANQLLAIPKFITTRVDAYTDKAKSQIQSILTQLNSIPRSISTTYYVNQVNRINKPAALPGNPDGSADGGTVPKSGRAYADRYHYLLADGEEVISNRYGQADRHRALLKRINANRLADGGTAGGNGGGSGGGDGSKQRDKQRQAIINRIQKLIDAREKQLDRENQRLDKLQQRDQEIRSGVASGLRSDIFAQPSNSWAAQQSPLAILSSDNRNIKRFEWLIHDLKNKGVDGAALQEIIASGDLQRAEMMDRLSRGNLATYERLYNQRQHALASVGATASRALGVTRQIGHVTDQIDDLKTEIKGLRKDVKQKQHADHKSRQDAADRQNHNAARNMRNGHRRGQK